MKRTVALLLIVSILLSALLSCGTNTNTDTAATDASPTSDQERAEALRQSFLVKANEVKISDIAVTFADGSGDGETILTIPKNPQKTVNLYSSLTTLWYEAGGSVIGCIGGSSAQTLYQEYIGRDITRDNGVATVATSVLGKKWDVEAILALRPDLIICSASMSGYSTIRDPAAAANIPVIVMEYNDFADYLKWFKVSCHLTGHPELWESVAIKALDEVVNVLMSCPDEDPPTVFSIFSGADSLKANTSRTVLGGMIHAMNAVNIVDTQNDATAEHLEINLETVYAADPDIILVQCHAGMEAAAELVERCYGSNPVWQSLTAVKEGRVYYLDKNLFHNKPNSRFAEAYATLAGILYPATQ